MATKERKIETTGQLRKFLTETIVQIREGAIGLDEAGKITKLAAQIHESFYSEIKIQKAQWEMGVQVKHSELGSLPLG